VNLVALSTSTPRGSAALVRDGALVAASAYADLQGHAERIFSALDAVLEQAGEPRGAIHAIACDIGPGSFTGVRVGIASAKGIALGLDIPVVGVVSLAAMAAAAFASGQAGPGDVVVAAVDAKKAEVFLAAYDAEGAEILAPCARARSAEAFAIPAPPGGGRVLVAGEVAVGLDLPPGVVLLRGDALDLPDAGWIGRLAAARLGAGAGDPAGVEPLYVRPPDAVPQVAV
jgi:tRNA threonylcarbamoyladenosine biosynthesis protein TsaB